MIDHALDFSSTELFRRLVGGWVFNARGAYVLYIIGTIGAALSWLIKQVMSSIGAQTGEGIASKCKGRDHSRPQCMFGLVVQRFVCAFKR